MILEVTYNNASSFKKELDQMFQARSKVFTDRLNWVPSMNGREVDQFDTYISKPVYIICVDDETREYRGSLRLIQMNYPNMFADVFPYLAKGKPITTSEDAIESSRIHLIDSPMVKRKKGINTALGELFAYLGIYMRKYAYDELVTVTDSLFLRILKMIGLKPALYSDEGYIEPDGCVSYVATFKPDDVLVVKKFFGIDLNDIKVLS
jgi:N-acyl-L-homoserine lactone synthetase